MKVKICGITNIEDALLCAENGVDALGFVFYNKSKRFISFEDAKNIAEKLSSFVMKVGVFVNEDANVVNQQAEYVGLDAVQLHGDEAPEYLAGIHHPQIKAFRVGENFDWSLIDQYKNCNILLDSFSKEQYGGTGKTFEWRIIPERFRHKIILSGGITSEKLEQIFTEIKPAAIDVLSSLEKSPGKKDKKKVIEFLEVLNGLRNN